MGASVRILELYLIVCDCIREGVVKLLVWVLLYTAFPMRPIRYMENKLVTVNLTR